jgi:hypothetical protein
MPIKIHKTSRYIRKTVTIYYIPFIETIFKFGTVLELLVHHCRLLISAKWLDWL